MLQDSRINRRMSTSFLQNLLLKQHNEKDEGDSRGSSDRGSLGDVSTVSSSITSVSVIPATKEGVTTVGQLMHYFNTLVVSLCFIVSGHIQVSCTT